MLDRRHAGLHCGADSLGAVGVSCHLDIVPRRLLHHRLQLCQAVLLRADRFLERQYAGGGARLNDLGAMLDLVADRLDDLVGTIGDTVLPCGLEHSRGEGR